MPSLTERVAIPSGANEGLTSPGAALMKSLLGNPRSSYTQECKPVTDPKLKLRIRTQNFGPFKATGFDLALASLAEVMAEIKAEHPAVFAALGTAGMLCARLRRGSTTAISNHSWGTTIDLTVGGVLDARGDGKVQFGLALIAPIFNRHKWFWGATFPTEDAMHFEVSVEKMREWQTQGKLFSPSSTPKLASAKAGKRPARARKLAARPAKKGGKHKSRRISAS